MARRTALEADQTRLTIMCAAVQMFCSAGYARTTLEEIARLAGVTRGAVYWHFESKQRLLESVCHDAVEALEEAFSTESPSSPLQAMVATAEALFRTVVGQGDALNISALLFKWGRQGGSDIIRDQRIALSVRLRNHAGGCLEHAVAARLLPAGTNILTAAFAYEAYVFGIVESWLFEPSFDLAAQAGELAGKAVGLVGALQWHVANQ
ncbi:TetR family transcriptional regulator [Cupriavidus lacunae]|uniref:HTH tetR-type domain-containing protein n=1 Tax=Cupriavidus lacunae TaxID=2666307 RepID=A0A370NKY8_9BURK|nr:TetR family transcriptional regulator [Cupriavidus lacunae]RDK06261.1 hypothetical protein DN412_32260 [Cupriavidus lacunae]